MNRYGQASALFLRVKGGQGRSAIDEVRFTAPFKITSPFYGEGNRLQVMLLSVSAGVMAGDDQQIHIDVGDGADGEILSQSYEKIHKMEPGESARRETTLDVGAGATLSYAPLPTIPYAGSSFSCETNVRLKDGTSRFFYADILACGRAARGERFAYRRNRNAMKAYLAGRLIYADNAVFEPAHMDMGGYCLYEGYSHLLSLFAAGFAPGGDAMQRIHELIQRMPETKAGVSLTGSGALCVRALADGSEPLLALAGDVKRILGEG